jgi:hypothetical protein
MEIGEADPPGLGRASPLTRAPTTKIETGATTRHAKIGTTKRHMKIGATTQATQIGVMTTIGTSPHTGSTEH